MMRGVAGKRRAGKAAAVRSPESRNRGGELVAQAWREEEVPARRGVGPGMSREAYQHAKRRREWPVGEGNSSGGDGELRRVVR